MSNKHRRRWQKFKQFVLWLLLYPTTVGIEQRRVKKYVRQKEQMLKWSNDKLDAMIINAESKLERMKNLIPFWIGIIFTAVLSGAGQKIKKFIGYAFVNRKNLKELHNLSQIEVYHVEAISMLTTGSLIVLICAMFFIFLYSSGGLKADLLCFQLEKKRRENMQ